MKKSVVILVAIAFFTVSCSGQATKTEGKSEAVAAPVDSVEYIWENKETSDTKTIHVFVALCDNKYQGIIHTQVS